MVGDGASRTLLTFRIEADGPLTSRQPYDRLQTRATEPAGTAGLTIESLSRDYAATRYGVQVFDPTGRLSGVLASPDRRPVTDVVIGGLELGRLYIVTGGEVYFRTMLARGVSGAASKR